PVLLNEVIKVLDAKEGEFFIDGTFGAGGHSAAIKEKIGVSGKLLTIDWDKTGENFADLPEILKRKNLLKADGLLLDLGFSSEQLSTGRGFSFQKNEPLLMTYDINAKPAKEILKELSKEELERIIGEYSQERFAERIAGEIKAREKIKPIETTQELVDVIKKAVPKNYERGRIHPATRTFMALRIYANRELENLEEVLKNIENILKPGGRIAIISFHSLEDGLVKNYFRKYATEGKMKILTKKPIIASREEIANNPRSRSAKLRAAQIL
ncbi:MAG: 16S rRNA (cytosine(1402)-N(4))-methyltransferase RsmH, partial [Patescibacteria group bacterium]